MSARVLWSSLIMLLALSLGACSESSSSSSAPNSFPPLSDDFTDSSSGDSSNTCSNLGANELCVTLEVPRVIAGGDATETRRNLFVVRPASVDVVRLADGGAQAENLSIARRRDDSGSMIITLEDFETVPLDPNLVVAATLSDGTVIRGPLSDVDQDVKVNPFSEYLVSEVLVGGQLSAEDIAEIQGCGELCLRRLIWPNLADTIQDFEISIPGDASIARAVELLGNRVDFTDYVTSMVETMKVDAATDGPSENTAATFNSVYFGLELNRRQQEADGTIGQWGTRRSVTRRVSGNGGSADIYPTLSLATFREFGLEVNSIAGEFPYQRQTQLYPEPEGYSSPTWNPNSHAFAPGFVLAQDNLLRGGRSPYQEVSEESDDQIWGWASNPYFFEGVRTGEAGSAGVMTGYFHSGKAIALEVEDQSYNRLGTLEDLAVGALEIDLEQISSTRQELPLSLTPFTGPYSAASFSVRFGNDATPIEARAQVQHLTANASDASAELIADATGAHRSAWSLKRESGGGMEQGPAPVTDPYDITLANQTDEYYINGAFEDAYYGRITASSDGRQGLGAAVENGTLLAYTFSGAREGQGINIIARQELDAVVEGTYTLQGVALGMAPDSNRLEQLNGATLTVNRSDSSAQLTSALVQVTQFLGEESRITDPRRAQQTPLGGTSIQEDGRFTVTLGENAGTVLQGFAIEGGDVLVMTLKGPDRVGLVLGFKEQSE